MSQTPREEDLFSLLSMSRLQNMKIVLEMSTISWTFSSSMYTYQCQFDTWALEIVVRPANVVVQIISCDLTQKIYSHWILPSKICFDKEIPEDIMQMTWMFENDLTCSKRGHQTSKSRSKIQIDLRIRFITTSTCMVSEEKTLRLWYYYLLTQCQKQDDSFQRSDHTIDGRQKLPQR